ncbi:MAG: TRAP transporter substrate-binding protein DctP [Rhodospirillaceae bacterium]
MGALRVLIAIFSLFVYTAGGAQAETVLSIGLALDMNSHYGTAAKVLSEEVTRRSDGRIRFSFHPDSKLGGEREMLVGLQVGTVDLVITSTGPVGTFVPATLITDIPFLFRDYAHARRVLDGPIGREILEQFPAKGMIALAWAENGFRHLTTSNRPVQKPADLQGLKLRVMQNEVHIRAFTTLGAKPEPMTWTKVYDALKSGRVDGQENPIPTILSAKFAEVQKYVSLTGHVYSPVLILMSARTWQALSESDRTLFHDSAKIAAAANRAQVDRQDREGLDTLRAAGMTITDVDRAAFQAALAPAYAEYARNFGQDRIDAIRNVR